jgi:hypothetical protein
LDTPLFQLGRLIAVLGIALVAAGALLMVASRLGFLGSLGRLPGDVSYRGRTVSFYFPIVTCLILSVVVTLVLWLISLFKRL